MYVTYTVEKISSRIWASVIIKKTDQSWQSPIGRKFAQTGHLGAKCYKKLPMRNEGRRHCFLTIVGGGAGSPGKPDRAVPRASNC
jgi:hypothetical protein